MSVAKRYAQALFDLGMEQDKLDQLSSDLQGVIRAATSNQAWKEWLEHPQVTVREKQEAVREAFAGRVETEVLNLLLLLVRNDRESLLSETGQIFQMMVDRHHKVAHAAVTSVQPLTEEGRQQILDTLQQMTGSRHVQLQEEIDPGLIGGVVVRIGDRLYDGSVKGLLQRLQKQMVQA